ncbi:dethiobiotin synthase [Desulfobacterales bacterium HSG16]|nr:dethiobiotin synthase [Desulfobacterales bacterium HSG16]
MIAGTDTGVGKTILSMLIMNYLFSKGANPFYIKPFQTGCVTPESAGSDAVFIYNNVKQLDNADPSDSVINCHTSPKAPWFAAEDMNETIDIQRTLSIINKMEDNYSHLIIEAAGGLFVPVNSNTMIIDIIQKLDAYPILAARAGLGTINHTLLSIEALRQRGIESFGIVLLDPEKEGTAKDMIRENIEAIEKFGNTKVAGVIGYLKNFRSPLAEHYSPLECFF